MRALYTALLSAGLATSSTLLWAQPANNTCATATALAVNEPAACPGNAISGTTVDATATGAAVSCDAGSVQDVWYSFSTTGFQSPFTLAIAAGDIGHWAVEVFATDCSGALVSCTPGSPASIALPGLAANTTYLVRVFTNTDLGAAGAFSLCLSAAPIISYCGNVVYDAGGPNGNYAGNLLPYNVNYTYCPDSPGDAINLTFTAFNTRAEDIVRIYNGPDNTFPLLGTFSGNLTTNLPGSFNSTHPSGCITLRFSYGGFFFTAPGWAATTTCCSTPLVSVAPSSSGPVCAGGELQLQANTNFATSFSWTGPNGFTSTDENPTLAGFSTANVGTYTLNANAGVTGCNASTSTVVVGLVLPPPSVTAAASETQLCVSSPVDLTATVPLNITAFQQGFESFPATGWGTAGTGVTAAQNSTYFMEGANSVRLTHAVDGDGSYAMTNNFDLSALPNPVLKFWHICALEQGYDYGFVEYSVNGGANWAQLPANSYLGTGNSQFNPNARFSRNSYSVWQTQFGSSTATPGTGPATDLWREEAFNLAAFSTSSAFRLRFRITSDVSINYYGWLLDDVRIEGTLTGVTYAWSSDPAGFSSSEQNPAAVQVDTTTTYTVTAFSAPGCGTSASVMVEFTGLEVSILGPPQISVCSGQQFTLMGNVIGAAPPVSLTWLNGDVVLSNDPALTNATLTSSSTIVYIATDGNGCTGAASVFVEVIPEPTVSIAAYGSACVNWSPFNLVGGSPAGGSYAVNGVPATTFDPAAGIGSYIITYTYATTEGCTGSASTTLEVVSCAGVEEFAGVSISLYPNPANDVIYVLADVGEYSLRILDAAGRAVLVQDGLRGSAAPQAIGTGGLVNGNYLVELVGSQGQRWVSRLAVAR
ncbi:MAG: hypothetical protein KF905_03805 [Flavobacteriales bacterium]|nr:hypothetical protein [Flavobacteriales bacterium]